MKNILICSNTMGIGGVETVILNQIVAFKKKGYNIYILAARGEYSEKTEQLGAKFIELNFPEENYINKERVEEIVRIIEKYSITEIHIHKYQCIPSMLVAACITKTPYYAYEHCMVDTKKYYTWNYPIYKEIFPIYFKNANKIVAITPKVAEITKKEYNIENEKYVIVHNGIDFEVYKNEELNYDQSIKKIFIISRIDEEKLQPIYNGITVFKRILENFPNAKLYIVGGGNAEDKVVEYLNTLELTNSYNSEEEVDVKLIGKQTDVIKYLKEADLLLGIGRCALEAIAMKIPVIITGYQGINGLITNKNMKIAMEENFSGINMNTITDEECLKEILYLKENKNKITEEVYQIARENLDCYKNYITIQDGETLKLDYFQIFEIIKNNVDLIEEQSEDIKAKYEWIQKIETENIELKEKNNELEEKLNNIYNSKRWKYTEKLANIFHKNKKI